MVNVPKAQRIFCKKCGKCQPHKVTRYKKESGTRSEADWPQSGKQIGYSGRQAHVPKEGQNHKDNCAQAECAEPDCRPQRVLAVRKCKHFEP
ncbi:hypothetical protein U0070_021335, partial [Myodes glareolus]